MSTPHTRPATAIHLGIDAADPTAAVTTRTTTESDTALATSTAAVTVRPTADCPSSNTLCTTAATLSTAWYLQL